MLKKVIRKARKLAFGADVKPGWHVPNPRNSDVYLISYPKSGNTWMRYLMTYAIWSELDDIDLVEMAAYIPSPQLEHDAAMMLADDSPCNSLEHRIIKEHSICNVAARKNVKKAIYLVRDGRDAIVSYWYFCNQRDQTTVPLSEFIENSSRPEHSYGAWKDHVTGWLEADLEARLVIRYEDLLQEPESWLKAAMEFSDIVVPDAVISRAVERASFGSMKKLEQTKGFNLDQLKTVEFVRQGKKGSWQENFGPGDLEKFNRFHGGCINELGYSW